MKKQNLKITTLTISVLLLFSCGGKLESEPVNVEGEWSASKMISTSGGVSEDLIESGAVTSLRITFAECDETCEATSVTEFPGSGTFSETYLYELINDGEQIVFTRETDVDTIEIVDYRGNSFILLDIDPDARLETHLER